MTASFPTIVRLWACLDIAHAPNNTILAKKPIKNVNATLARINPRRRLDRFCSGVMAFSVE